MLDFTIDTICHITGGKLLMGPFNQRIHSVSIDSRNMSDNTLFIPIRGEKTDGHLFISDAIKNNAKAFLTESEDFLPSENGITEEISAILVENTEKALQDIASSYRKTISVPTVGITGSVGKTTTRELVSAALSSERTVYKTLKNYNNRLGVPMTLLGIPENCDQMVLELGMNVPGELSTISSLCNLNRALITNIGDAHITYYGSRENIAKEKMTITDGFSPNSFGPKILFLNGDCPELLPYKKSTEEYEVFTYGLTEGNDYQAKNISYENGYATFSLFVFGKEKCHVSLSVLGEHNILNSVAALAVADSYRISLEKAAKALSSYQGFQGRLNRIEKDGIIYIDDTYNASPDSMKAGFKVLDALKPKNPSGRKIAILGDMFELGEKTSELHYEVGEALSQYDFSLVILIGKNVKSMKDALEKAHTSMEVVSFADIDSASEYIRGIRHESDIFYLKASNGMHFSALLKDLLKDE